MIKTNFGIADILLSKVAVDHYIMVLQLPKKKNSITYVCLNLGNGEIMERNIDPVFWTKVA